MPNKQTNKTCLGIHVLFFHNKNIRSNVFFVCMFESKMAKIMNFELNKILTNKTFLAFVYRKRARVHHMLCVSNQPSNDGVYFDGKKKITIHSIASPRFFFPPRWIDVFIFIFRNFFMMMMLMMITILDWILKLCFFFFFFFQAFNIPSLS